MKVFLPNCQSISSNPILTSLLMEFGLPLSFFILLLKTDIDSLKVFPFPKVLYKLFCIKYFSHNKSFYQLLVISPVSGFHFTTTFGSSSCFGYKRKKGSHNELPFFNGKGGKTGIRTPDTLWRYTRFPGVPLKPLEHLSFDRLSAIWMFSHIADAKVIIIKLTIASRDAHLIYFKY